GNKMVIQGILNIIVKYTSNDGNNSIFTFSSNIPFSTFIVLPKNYREGSKIDISSTIENTSFKTRTNDSIYTNVSVLIMAKIHPYDILMNGNN
ncbi:MAG: DUF3794 domain-containing protein, partial [Clostridium sp.]